MSRVHYVDFSFSLNPFNFSCMRSGDTQEMCARFKLQGHVILKAAEIAFPPVQFFGHIQPRPPYNFYHPYNFLPVRPSEAPVGILRRCCSRGHIRLRAPVRFDTAVHLWFHRIVCRTPHGPRARLMWALYRPRTGLSDVFQFLRDPYGARVWPVCHTAPLQTRKGIDTTRICKNPCGHRIWRYGAGTGPLHLLHGLLRGCLRVPNPYGPVSL